VPDDRLGCGGTGLAPDQQHVLHLPDSVSPTDTELIGRLALNDSTCLRKLYDRHSVAVYSMAIRIAREPSLAEDAVQDTFCQAWREASQHDPARGSVRGWLLMIVRARTLDRLRARGRRTALISPLDEGAIASAEDSAPWPDARASEREQLSSVRTVLQLLPERDRHLIDLAFFEGLTHSEIAAHLHQPLGTIKTHLRRTLRILRGALNDTSDGALAWQASAEVITSGPIEPAALQNRRILVVNNDVRAESLMMLVLQRAGATIDHASSPSAAARRVSAEWPDVLLADLELPGNGGYTVLSSARETARRLRRRLPAMGLARASSRTSSVCAVRADCDLQLVKPLVPSTLVNAIARLLASYSSDRPGIQPA
jgi:RNA polymerase sigma-70 factor, ECF subfamily